MKRILITGATGFVGSNLVSYMLDKKYKIRVFVRANEKFDLDSEKLEVFRGDLTRKKDVMTALEGVHTAYYLVHSMSQTRKFMDVEGLCAENFAAACTKQNVKRIVYLGGIISAENDLSQHLKSRKLVGSVLRTSTAKVTEFRAAILIGKGGASYEIIKRLVERLPFLVWPTWANTLCQPIALQDVLYYLEDCLKKAETAGKIYGICGTVTMRYKDLLKVYAQEIRKPIFILTVPMLPHGLVALVIAQVTDQPLNLVKALLESLRCDSVCKETDIRKILPKNPLSYRQAIQKTL